MIFGFNTDATHDGVVYHVQSEAREKDLLLQTQVFVQGRCIGKRACSYAGQYPDVAEDILKETLKVQHRTLLDAVRDGSIEETLAGGEEIQDLDGGGLALKWLNSDESVSGNSAQLKFRVTENSVPVHGAKLTARMATEAGSEVHASAETDADGSAVMQLEALEEQEKEIPLLIQATADGKRATRKFRLRRSRV